MVIIDGVAVEFMESKFVLEILMAEHHSPALFILLFWWYFMETDERNSKYANNVLQENIYFWTYTIEPQIMGTVYGD